MARSFADFHYIAAGFNNKPDMERFNNLNPPYFANYSTYIKSQFYRSEGSIRTGSRRNVPIGLPYYELTFELVSQEEFQYIRTTFTNGEDGEVTFRGYDSDADAWTNYNALMKLPEASELEQMWSGFDYREFKLSFYDMRAI